jgi:putative ABC transport system permease protein
MPNGVGVSARVVTSADRTGPVIKVDERLILRPLIMDLWRSLLYLRRSPGFSSIAVITLALGIAGNTAVFSIINATFLQPLPYPDQQKLVIVRWSDQPDLSASMFFLLKNRCRVFSSLAAWYPFDEGVNISAGGPPKYVRALSVSKDFFQTFGIAPQVGNVFVAEDNDPKGPRTVVLSHALWTQMFARDPSALQRTMMINNESYTVIGVMPEGFRSYPDVDIWLPLALSPNSPPGDNYRVFGRLAAGVSRPEMRSTLAAMAGEFRSIYPDSPRRGSLLAESLRDFLVADQREGLKILFAAVGFLFLVACSNVAILILVRAAASTHGVAVRAALGATRPRLVFGLMGESLLLAFAGGLVGLILAKESLPLILKLWPTNLSLITQLTIDWHVVLFTVAVAVLSVFLFGLVPALKFSRLDIVKLLASSSRTATSSAETVKTVRLLVFAQMTLTVMLTAGTLLLVSSLLNLYSVPLGFDPDRLVVGRVSLAGKPYQTTAQTQQLLDEVVRRVESLSGIVDTATAMNGLPLDQGLNLAVYPIEVPSLRDHDDEYRPVTYDFFKTFRIPLLAGRFFSESDFAGNTPVAIINESMARRWWPNATAIGHSIQVDKELGPEFADVPRQIIGVVADIHEKGPAVAPLTTVYLPIGQTPDSITAFANKTFLTSLVIRTSRKDLSDQVGAAVRSVDPNLALASFSPFSEIVDRSLADRRFIAILSTTISAFAVLLAIVGIHGLLSYQARLSTREIAIRLAVGGRPAHIIRLVLLQGAKLISLAILAGMAGSFVTRNLLGSFLYNVQGSAVTLIVATGFLLGFIAVLINLLTALRAASIDPVAVLRNE